MWWERSRAEIEHGRAGEEGAAFWDGVMNKGDFGYWTYSGV